MDTSNKNNKPKLIGNETTSLCSDVAITTYQHGNKNVMIGQCGHCDKSTCQYCITEHIENKEKPLKEIPDYCKQKLFDQVEYLPKQNCSMAKSTKYIDDTMQQLAINRYLAEHEVDKTFERFHKLFSDKKDEIYKEINHQFTIKNCKLQQQKMEIENVSKTVESTYQKAQKKADGLSSTHTINEVDSGVSCEESYIHDDYNTGNSEMCLDQEYNSTEESNNTYIFKNNVRNNVRKSGNIEVVENTGVNIGDDLDIFDKTRSYLEQKYEFPCVSAHLVWKSSSKIYQTLEAIETKDFGKVLCCRTVVHRSILNGNILQHPKHHCVINCDQHVTLTTKTHNGDIEMSNIADINANITCVGQENFINSDSFHFSNNSECNILSTSLSLDAVNDNVGISLLTSTPIKTCSSEILLAKNRPILCKIKKIELGVFDISFRINQIGKYDLDVKLFGKHVVNSPCRINAISTNKSVPRTNLNEITKKQKALRKRIRDSNFATNPIDIGELFQLGSRGRSLGEFANPQDVAITPDNRVYVTDSNNQCVQVFEISGRQNVEVKCIFRFGEKGRNVGQMLRPTGVAILSADRIAVSDYDNKVVNVYTKEGKFCTRVGAGKLLGPRGVCVDNSGNIIVVDNKQCKVFTFQSNGKLIRHFGSRGIGDSQLAGPHYAAVNQIGDIFVTDFYNHCVKVFTSRGVYIRSIGSHGKDIGEFNAPTGISIDIKGHVIVADWGNSRLQVFDQCGLFIGFIKNKEEQMYGPQGVTTTSGGFVAVADSGNQCVKVYRIKQ